MNNVNANSVIAVLAQPTNNDGTRKAGVWPTKGHDMLDNGTINAVVDDTGASINGKHVPTAVLTAKALQPVFEGGETLSQWLAYMEQGFVSYQQHRAATGSAPVIHASAAIDETLMTADEREEYYLSRLVPANPVLLPLFTTANNASIDIDERITALAEALAALKAYKKELSTKRELSQEQKDSIALQRVKEARFDGIIAAGATISKTKSKSGDFVYMAKCPLSDVANIIGIVQADFVLIGAPAINMSDMTSLVTFKDKPEA